MNPTFNPSERLYSKDFFFKKKIIVYQKKKGYRFSIDAPILAHFLPHCSQNALEIGTGCGIISLLALYQKKFSFVWGVEIQKSLAKLAEWNCQVNGFTSCYKVFHGDFRQIYSQFNGIPHIYANPPYQKVKTGKLSPNREIKCARSEIYLSLKELLQLTGSILPPKGNLYLIIPYRRYDELLSLASEISLSVCRTCLVYSYAGGKPERILIQLTNDEVISQEMPPLTIFKDIGIYTDEMENVLSGLVYVE